jgi:hypothetical protein
MPLSTTNFASASFVESPEVGWQPPVRDVSPAPAGETLSNVALLVRWRLPRQGHGTEAVDLYPVLGAFKGFRRLVEDRTLFETARLSEDGIEVEWEDGSALAVSTIERLAREQMSNDDFRSFLSEMRLTFDSAAAALGLSRRLIAYYAADRPIPRHVALACQGFVASLERYAQE